LQRAALLLGAVLAFSGVFFFYGVFSDVTPGLLPMVSAIILVPLGSALAFYGVAYQGIAFAAGKAEVQAPRAAAAGGSGTLWAAIGVAVISMVIAGASLSIALSTQANLNLANNQLSQLTSSVGGLGNSTAAYNAPPAKVAVKVDWCNTDPTGQDRFCPNQIVVYQGDIVQLMFIHNDTDAHTFTLLTPPYNFQINDSSSGMRNFLDNSTIAGDCSNDGSYAQQSANISEIYCVSGSSLLDPSVAGNFIIAQNTNPANPGGPGGVSLVILPVDNKVSFDQVDISSGAGVQIWGIGAFQASEPGVYEFICHYHVSNGMFGYLIVLPNAYCNSNPVACGISSTP
jgi:plastocyanin